MPAAAERPKPAGRLIPAAWRQLTRTRDHFVARMPDRLESSRVLRWRLMSECVSFSVRNRRRRRAEALRAIDHNGAARR